MHSLGIPPHITVSIVYRKLQNLLPGLKMMVETVERDGCIVDKGLFEAMVETVEWDGSVMSKGYCSRDIVIQVSPDRDEIIPASVELKVVVAEKNGVCGTTDKVK